MKSILKTYNINTKETKIIKVFDKHMEAPNFTSNGQVIVYNSLGDIYFLNVKTKKERLLDTGDLFCNNDHVISSDGLNIAVSAETSEENSSKIYILSANGGEMKLITQKSPSYLHGWNNDTAELAYCASRDGSYDIYTISEDGSNEKRLTTSEGLNDGPEYTPDGKYIWFNSVRSGLMQIWRMDSDGSNQQQMTDDDMNNWFAHIAPDNKKAVFISYNPQEVRAGDHPPNKNIRISMLDLENGEIQILFDAFGGQGTINVNSWHPNSIEFAFVTYEI